MQIRVVGIALIAGALFVAGYWHAGVFAALSSNGSVTTAAPEKSPPVVKQPQNDAQSSAAGKAPPPPAVVTAVATSGVLDIQRRTIGWLASPASVNLTSVQQGAVVALTANEGQNHQKGDVVAKLDDRVAQSVVGRDGAQIERDQVLLAQAVQNLSRAQALLSKGAGTQQSSDDAQTAEKTAAATVDVDNATLAADQVALSNTDIKAPFDGRLGAFQVAVGSLVQPGGAIVLLTQMSPLQVKFALPEGDLALVKQAIQNGQASIRVNPTADASAAFTGSIDFIDSMIDTASGTFNVRATIANADLALWPGESVTVVVALSSTSRLVMVPTQAVQPTPSGSIAYVLAADSTIDVRKVTIAGADSAQTGISTGLRAGEHVVVEGQISLSQGMKVAETLSSAVPVGSLPQPAVSPVVR